ncbi:hypothetical protein P4519_14670, partial [Geobacillus stearothermophilus]|uniref:hypothetical protein n=2 Tax=Geobacillus stearothermophilus TaxID=1422 RepID=UPI002E1F3A46|nr:hypothetical protein [Geobacillus stearothermophilus]MED3766403.1 hypothetical protein [Geobacillus stearothermophilus]
YLAPRVINHSFLLSFAVSYLRSDSVRDKTVAAVPHQTDPPPFSFPPFSYIVHHRHHLFKLLVLFL